MDDLKRTDIRFDVEAADRALRFFELKLKLSEGQFEGMAFQSQPAQDFIIGSLFGWKKLDGFRRFRRAYIEQGKGNGKSPLAGGIGLYGLTADDEAGAEIYAAGATKDQAGILFRDAVKMVRQSPDLAKRITTSGGPGREYNLAYLKRSSFFRPISRETKKTGSGPRPHFALVDELHEHQDSGIIEILERGFKFRQQPLLLMITNSGSDRNSACWQEHEHAIKVAAGNLNARDDDSFYLGENIDDDTFSYVCALDSARTEVYSFDIALRHAVDSCSCNAQITLKDLPSPQDFAALVIQRNGGQKISQKDLAVSITPTVRLFLDAFVTLATRDGVKIIIPTGVSNAAPTCANTQKANGQKNGRVKETKITERERKSLTRIGVEIEHASQNTESPLSTLKKSAQSKAGFAESAEVMKNASEWIIATIQELFGASYATNAIQESVCSEIISNLFNAHSNTCATRQRFRLVSGRLAEDLPADNPLEQPECWIKANPLIDVTITTEYLAGVVKQAKAIPGKLNNILRLHFCQWTDADTAWMTRATLEPCLVDFEPLDEHAGKPVFMGADLSQVKDMTALGYCVQSGTNEEGKPIFDAWVEAWTPGDTIKERALQDKQPYEEWVRSGFLNAPKGQSINYLHIAQAIAEANHDYNVQCLAYDRYAFSRMLEPKMQEIGLSIECVEHPQGGTKKGKPTEAMKEACKAAGREPEGLWMPMSVRQVEELILEGRIRLRKNPVLISAMMSAVTDEDRWGNYWLAKERAINKIDCAIALCMAVGAAMAHENGSTVDDWLAGLAA